MSLPVDDFIDLLLRAAEERRREELRQVWLALLPWSKDPKPFEQYYQENTVRPTTRRTAKEIIADVEDIRRAAAAQ